jgi:glycosyltransferase involved in cell wall biosynthesis
MTTQTLQQKLDGTLFVGINVMNNYVNGYPHKIKHLISLNLKTKTSKDTNNVVDQLISHVNSIKPNVIFFIYNCLFIQELILRQKKHKISPDIKIIAWHQKHYFPAHVVPNLHAIIEYSKVQALKCPKANRSFPNKYIYLPYPSLLPPNYPELFDKIPQDRKERYTGKYIFSGGNNRRDLMSTLNIIKAFPQYKFVVLSNSPKYFYRLHKHGSKLPPNFYLYDDTEPIEFAYAVKNSYFCFLPYDKPGCTPGHSVSAQCIFFGKPIISTKNCSMDEAVNHGKSGYLVNKNFESYKTHISELMENPKLHSKMTKKTRKMAPMRHFSFFYKFITDMVDKTIV